MKRKMYKKNSLHHFKKKDMSKKKILITGGSGFIGSSLVNFLFKKDYDITVLDNLSPQIHGINPEKSLLYRSIIDKCNFVKGDVVNKKDWQRAVLNNEVIIHLAAETGTGQSMYEIQQYTNVNSLSTAILLDLLVNTKNNVEKVILSSTRALYGEGKYLCSKHGVVYPHSRKIQDMQNGDYNCKCPRCGNNLEILSTDEESLINPTSVYGITKHFQEELIMNVCKSIGLPSVSLRFQNVYGPGQSLSNPYTGILSIFSKLLLNNKDVNIFEDGQESRDFIYIDDIVKLIYLSIEDKNADYNIFNGGTGIMTTVKEVAESLKSNYQSESKINVTGSFRVGDIRHNYADMKKSNEILGFKSIVSFNEGILNFCNWVNEQYVEDSSKNYLDSINEMKNRGLFYE